MTDQTAASARQALVRLQPPASNHTHEPTQRCVEGSDSDPLRSPCRTSQVHPDERLQVHTEQTLHNRLTTDRSSDWYCDTRTRIRLPATCSQACAQPTRAQSGPPAPAVPPTPATSEHPPRGCSVGSQQTWPGLPRRKLVPAAVDSTLLEPSLRSSVPADPNTLRPAAAESHPADKYRKEPPAGRGRYECANCAA